MAYDSDPQPFSALVFRTMRVSEALATVSEECERRVKKVRMNLMVGLVGTSRKSGARVGRHAAITERPTSSMLQYTMVE